MRSTMVLTERTLEGTSSKEPVYRQYLPLVQSLARRIHRRLPQSVEFDDLVSAGMLGLLEASVKFDPAKNVDFSSYAYRRVQGAILDSLRDLDWAPRALRRRAREVQEVIRSLSVRLYRNPLEEEVAAELQIPLSEYQHLLGDLASLEIGSLHRKVHDESGEEELVCATTPEGEDPLVACLRGELESRLASAVEQLPDRERTVVRLYFTEGRSRTEIAEILGIEAVEVGRIRASALLALRAVLNGAAPARSKAPIPFRRSEVQMVRDAHIRRSAA